MPVDYAKRLAAILVEEDEETVTVDLPSDGFEHRVAQELEKLGFAVDRHPTRPGRLTIRRKLKQQEGSSNEIAANPQGKGIA